MKLRLVVLFLLFIVCTVVVRHYAASMVAHPPDRMMPVLAAQDDVLRPAVPEIEPTFAHPGAMPRRIALADNPLSPVGPPGAGVIEERFVRPVFETLYADPSAESRRDPRVVVRYVMESSQTPVAGRMTEEEIEKERKLVETALRYREEESDEKKQQLREEMQQLASELLDLQQQRWSEKIDELTAQLEKLKALQEERSEREDEIIERRINRLLSEPDVLDWDPLAPQAGIAPTLVPGSGPAGAAQLTPVPPAIGHPGPPHQVPGRHIRSAQRYYRDSSGKEHPRDVHHYQPGLPGRGPQTRRPAPAAPTAPAAPAPPTVPNPESEDGAAFDWRRESETRVQPGEEAVETALEEFGTGVAQVAVTAKPMTYAAGSEEARVGSAFERLNSIKKAASDVLRSMSEARSSKERLRHFERLRQKGLATSSTADAARNALQEAQREIEMNTQVLDALEDQLQLEQKILESEMAALEEARAAAKEQYEAGQGSRAAVAAGEAALQRAQLQREGLGAALNLLKRLEEQIEEVTMTATAEPAAEEGRGEAPDGTEEDPTAPSNGAAETAQP